MLAGLGLGLGLGLGGRVSRGGSPDLHPSTTTTRPAVPAAVRPASPGSFQVGSTSVVVSDPLPSGTRSLPTVVWFPTETSAGRSLGSSRFPLLVFSQGFDLAVSAYDGLISAWASAGYVVAAPTYPDTDPSSPQLNESDIVNHPADLRAVIATVQQLATRPGSVFDEVNPDEVGVVGHSDGGDVSLAVADNSAYQDPAVKAVAVLSGAELASFGGTYFDGPPVPLLAVQGSADTVNPPACSVQFYDQAPQPKYYVDLLGAGHEPPYTDPGSTAETVVARVTTAFFDAELAGEAGALAAMTSAADVGGVSELFAGTPPPAATGGCPGAPS